MLRNVLRDRDCRTTRHPFDIIGQAVVPACAVQSRHGGDVLFDVRREANGLRTFSNQSS
jgi:hypothetical protein